MENIYLLITIAFFIASVMALVLTVLAFSYLKKKGTVEFIIFIVLQTVGGVIQLFELNTASPTVMKILVNIGYISAVYTGSAWLSLALGFTDTAKRFRLVVTAAILAIPTASLVLFWTNDAHGFMLSSLRFFSVGSFQVYEPLYGVGAWIITIYNYIVIILAAVLYVKKIRKFFDPVIGRVKYILPGSLFPILTVILFYFFPVPGVDFLPLGFSLAGLFMFTGMFYYHPWNIISCARNILVDGMSDGVVITDRSKRILYNNHQFDSLASGTGADINGRTFDELDPPWMKQLNKFLKNEPVETDMVVDEAGKRYFNVRITPVYKFKRISGYLIVLRDITRLRKKSAELQHIATTDYLTGAYNRRYFTFLASKKYYYAVRFKTPISILLIVIDGFKEINVAYGHSFGDKIIINFYRICQANIRNIDLMGRYDGTKFILFLPGTDYQGAEIMAQRVHQIIHYKDFLHESGSTRVSISIGGVSCTPDRDVTIDMLIKMADDALIKTQKKGNNTVLIKSYER